MKTLKVFLCLVALQFVSLVVFESCCKNTLDSFTFSSLSIQNSGYQDSLGLIQDLEAKNIEKILALDYAIYGLFEMEFLTKFDNYKNWHPLISTSVANSCDNDLITDLKLKAIHIKSLEDFDEEHLRGTNLSSYFKANDSFMRWDTTTYDMDFFVEYYNEQLAHGWWGGYDFLFRLNQTPTLDSIFRFEVAVEWENGDRLIDTTEQIILY